MRLMAMAGALAITGCSAVQMTESSGTAGTPVAGVAMSGVVHGGQFPIAGATIQLYAVGTTGYGSEAYPLLNISVTTGTNGTFGFTTANWTCVPGTYIYLTATGGTEQTQGSANPYSANVAALGNCSNINTNTYIVVNEVTTVAAVWALQQFISIVPGTSLLTQPGTGAGVTPAVAPAFSIGTSSTNLQGLQNAFAVAAVLANTNYGQTPGVFAGSYTGPGTQANRVLTVETWHINTIADVLASCINSNPQGGSTTCSTLATSVTPSGTAPADTFEIAYEMAQNPTYNVSNTFGFATGGGTPFLPYDGAVADWTVAYKVAYTYQAGNGTNDYTVMNTGEGIAFDSFGNAWVANTGHSYSYLPAFVTELDPTGDFVSTYSSYNVGTTPTNFGVAVSSNFFMPLVIDPSNNIWTEDTGNSNLVRIAATSGVGVASTGTDYGISTGTTTLMGNSAMASDANGEIFAGLFGGSGAAFNATFGTNNDKGIALLVPSIGSTLTAGTGSLVAPSGNTTFKGMAVTQSLSGTYGGGGFLYATSTTSLCSSPNSAALNMYFSQAATVTGSTSGSTTTSAGEVTPVNTIVDTGGTSPCSSVGAKLPTASSTYASIAYTVPAMATPVGLGVDSSDNLWVVNQPSAVTVTGYPQYWMTELTPTYTTGATTGALSASYTPQVFTAAFLAGLSGAANSYTPNTGAFVDGSNNVWSLSSSQYGTVAALNAASGFLNNTSTFTATLTSGTNNQTWTCGGFCGGVTYAQYGARRGAGSGFSGAAVDLSGNVWAVQSVSGGNSVTVFVGVAGPTVTPISLAAKNHAFGKKP
jgi:hypothetical protein